MHDTDGQHWLKQGGTASTEIRSHYDDWAESYDGDLSGWGYHAPAEAADMLKRTVAPTAEILDAGCGTGLTGQALRAAGFTAPIDGIDLSSPSLDLARQLGVYRTLGEGNLQQLPLAIADNSYGGLICIGVLTYVPDSEAVLREFARIVRPGGTVVATQREDLFRERDFAGAVASAKSRVGYGSKLINN
jgi:predicted TPR repeat methyltransferase